MTLKTVCQTAANLTLAGICLGCGLLDNLKPSSGGGSELLIGQYAGESCEKPGESITYEDEATGCVEVCFCQNDGFYDCTDCTETNDGPGESDPEPEAMCGSQTVGTTAEGACGTCECKRSGWACPECPENGVACEVGSNPVLIDDCNTCYCMPSQSGGGVFVCSDDPCDQQECTPGETLPPPDPCVKCVCASDGHPACDMLSNCTGSGLPQDGSFCDTPGDWIADPKCTNDGCNCVGFEQPPGSGNWSNEWQCTYGGCTGVVPGSFCDPAIDFSHPAPPECGPGDCFCQAGGTGGFWDCPTCP